uniref:Uncharacterized protein n=1 Tax=Lepeophtheirus salmonis TaxID=72036 RepID=A0A0K2UF97_LEPSM
MVLVYSNESETSMFPYLFLSSPPVNKYINSSSSVGNNNNNPIKICSPSNQKLANCTLKVAKVDCANKRMRIV